METEIPETEIRQDRASGQWAWPVIIVSVVAIVWMVLKGPPALDENSEAPAAESAGVPFEMLTIQLMSKGLIIQSPQVAREGAKALEEVALPSDQLSVAVAALHRFFDESDESLESALEILDQRRESASADPEFLDAAEESIINGVSKEERAVWADKLGTWAASLFPENENGDVPARAEIVKDAKVMVVGMFGFIIWILGSLLIGAVLWIIVIVVSMDGRRIWKFDRSQVPARVLIESFALFIGLFAISALFESLLTVVFYIAAFVMGMIWPVFRGFTWKETRKALGLHRGEGIFRELLSGLVGYFALIPIAAIGILLTSLIIFGSSLIHAMRSSASEGGDAQSAPLASPSHPIMEWLAVGDWRVAVFSFVLASVIAPLVEETVFRGALFRGLRSRWRFWSAGLMSSFIFAIIHPQGWMAAPALTAMGIGFAVIREWRDSLIAPMTAHAISNGVLVIVMVLAF